MNTKKIYTWLNKHEKQIFHRSFVCMALLVVIFFVNIKTERVYNNNPGVIPPQNNYDRETSLDTGKQLELETKLFEREEKITNFVPGTGKKVDLGNGIVGITDESNPPQDWFISKATLLSQLGRNNEAVETINELFTYYEKSSSAWEFLGDLYRRLDKYELAIKNYEKIIESSDHPYIIFYKKLAQLYVELGDGQKAAENYFEYERNGGERDEKLIKKIGNLNK